MRPLSTVGLAVLTLLALDPPALGYGGFVSAPGERVVATRQHVVLAQRGDRVEAHVLASFEGEAQAFGWLIPTPARPEVHWGSDALLHRLDISLQPRFATELAPNPACPDEAPGDPTGECGDDKLVVRYGIDDLETTVLDAADDRAVRAWLQENGFAMPADAEDWILEPYLGPSRFFAAVRLESNGATGDIPPLVVSYPAETLSIPIRSSAVGAADDMPLVVDLLGPARAAPLKYAHVGLNLEHVAWILPGDRGRPFQLLGICLDPHRDGRANYVELVRRAVDEADAGHGFVTEAAGDFDFSGRGSYPLDAIRSATTLEALMTAIGDRRFIDGRQGRLGVVLRAEVAYPERARDEGIDEDAFYDRLHGYATGFTRFGDVPADGAAVADAIEAEIVAPDARAEALFDGATVATRLFTVLSPAEMTLDPEFAFNADLERVDVGRRAYYQPACAEDAADDPTAGRLTLPDGRQLCTSPDDWLRRLDEANAPAARRIEDLSDEGPPVDRVDNSERLTPSDCAPTDGELARADGGCRAGGAAAFTPVLLLLAMWTVMRCGRMTRARSANGARRAERQALDP